MSRSDDTVAHSRETAEPSTRLRIQEAAVRLFAAKGFQATGIREIADQAGVRTSALYYYMSSKEDLLMDIMVSILRKLIVAAEDSLSQSEGPPERLVALVRTHVGLHAFERLRALVGDDELRALGPVHRAQVMELRDDYEGLWAGVLDEGISSHQFAFEDAKMTRLALLEMCNGVSRWYSEEGMLDVEDVCDRFAELALALVGARTGERPLCLEDLKTPPAALVLKIVRRHLAGGGTDPATVAVR